MSENPTENKVYVIEVDYYKISQDDIFTLYLSDTQFRTKPTDTGYESISFWPDIEQGLYFKTSLFGEDRPKARTNASRGDVVLRDAEQKYAALVLDPDNVFVGYSIRCKRGGLKDDYANFTTTATAIITDVLPRVNKANTMIIKCAGAKAQINEAPVNTTVYQGNNPKSDIYENQGLTPRAGKVVPRAFGQIFNASPELINTLNEMRQIHDGAIEKFDQIRDKGIVLPSSLFAATLAGGTFTLTNQPAGQVTCDVKGAKIGGTYTAKAGAIIEHILTSALTSYGSLNTSSFQNFALSAPVGLYLDASQMMGNARERLRTLADAVDELLSGILAFLEEDEFGNLYMREFDSPGTPEYSFEAGDIEKIEFIRIIQPVYRVKVNYRKNYSVQDEGSVAVLVDTEYKELFAEPYSQAYAEDLTIRDTYPLAREVTIDSLLANKSDAQALADKFFGIYGQPMGLFDVTLRNRRDAAQLVRCGSTQTFTYPFTGFTTGKDCRIVDRAVDTKTSSVKLTCFGPLD